MNPAGLTEAEATARARAGLANVADATVGRTAADIVRANVFTRFNAILGALLAVIVVVGPVQDGLFGVVLVLNTAIGIAQEVRAKRVLDRLALLAAARARVVRGGSRREIAVEEVVVDDMVEVAPGDEVVVDGELVLAEGLEVDESLVSGEAEPVAKAVGDRVLSGTYVAAGHGLYRATGVGPAAYARVLAREAKRFTLVRSDLRMGIDRILRFVTWIIVPTGVLLVSSQVATHESLAAALRGSVAGIGAMVPEGLVLLSTVAFAVGGLRLARRRVLLQELAAIEGLARVDVVCLDKTGTLTARDLDVTALDVLDPDAPVECALGAVAAADPAPNATLQAVARAFPAPPEWSPTAAVPFSSARKWAAAAFDGHGVWVLGAPDSVLAPAESEVRTRAARVAGEGSRVLLLAAADRLPETGSIGPVRPVALVALQESVRPEAPATLAYFASQGVAVKVVSGDHPATVAAVAARAGLADGGVPFDARDLPEDPGALGDVLAAHVVFGRVTPQQKRAIVGALHAAGHVVAMTGDGVNDVLALKDADIGVAMGSGTPASRGVAQLVLLDDSFAALPEVVAEGRRVIANIERVANLFVTKTGYAFLLAVAVGVARLPFPFLPRHLTAVSSLTIGIPAFFLALGPNTERARPGFVGRVLAFAVPAGAVAAGATFAAYNVARQEHGVSLPEAQTTATVVLFAVGMAVLAILARPVRGGRSVMVLALVGAFAALFLNAHVRRLFSLDVPPTIVLLAAVGVIGIAYAVLWSGWAVATAVRVRRGGVSGPSAL